MLVGNKVDQPQKVVSRDEGLKFARKHHMLFIESSAKTKEGVQCAFEELVEKVSCSNLSLIKNINSGLFQILQTPGLWEAQGQGLNLTSNGSPASSNCYCSTL